MHQCSARAPQNTEDNMRRWSMWMKLETPILLDQTAVSNTYQTTLRKNESQDRLQTLNEYTHAENRVENKCSANTSPRPERFSLMVASLLQRAIARKISSSCLHALMLHCPDTPVTSAKCNLGLTYLQCSWCSWSRNLTLFQIHT